MVNKLYEEDKNILSNLVKNVENENLMRKTSVILFQTR